MEFRVSCGLNMWIENLVIECKNDNELVDKIYSMTLQEMIDNGMIIRLLNFTELSRKIIYQTLKISISNIKYQGSPDLNLPTAILTNITLTENDDDIEENIKDAILSEVGWDYEVESFEYKIIDKY